MITTNLPDFLGFHGQAYAIPLNEKGFGKSNPEMSVSLWIEIHICDRVNWCTWGSRTCFGNLVFESHRERKLSSIFTFHHAQRSSFMVSITSRRCCTYSESSVCCVRSSSNVCLFRHQPDLVERTMYNTKPKCHIHCQNTMIQPPI